MNLHISFFEPSWTWPHLGWLPSPSYTRLGCSAPQVLLIGRFLFLSLVEISLCCILIEMLSFLWWNVVDWFVGLLFPPLLPLLLLLLLLLAVALARTAVGFEPGTPLLFGGTGLEDSRDSSRRRVTPAMLGLAGSDL